GPAGMTGPSGGDPTVRAVAAVAGYAGYVLAVNASAAPQLAAHFGLSDAGIAATFACVSIGAVGHSILVAAYHMLDRNQPYHDLGADYFPPFPPTPPPPPPAPDPSRRVQGQGGGGGRVETLPPLFTSGGVRDDLLLGASTAARPSLRNDAAHDRDARYTASPAAPPRRMTLGQPSRSSRAGA